MSIANPKTRDEFKRYILAKAGAPILQINTTDDQIEIAVEESLRWFWDYHYNGQLHTYFIQKVDQASIDSRSFRLPDEIIGVNEVYTFSKSSITSILSNPLAAGYQMMLDMAMNLSSGGLSNYYVNRQNYELVQQLLYGQTPIRFNEHNHVIYIDKSWDAYTPDQFIALDAYARIDPEDNPDVWSDRWLLKYATEKLKYQWGFNLSKFAGTPLPGGVTFNGQDIMNNAHAELKEIEENMLRDYSIPPRDYVG